MVFKDKRILTSIQRKFTLRLVILELISSLRFIVALARLAYSSSIVFGRLYTFILISHSATVGIGLLKNLLTSFI